MSLVDCNSSQIPEIRQCYGHGLCVFQPNLNISQCVCDLDTNYVDSYCSITRYQFLGGAYALNYALLQTVLIITGIVLILEILLDIRSRSNLKQAGFAAKIILLLTTLLRIAEFSQRLNIFIMNTPMDETLGTVLCDTISGFGLGMSYRGGSKLPHLISVLAQFGWT